MDFSQMSDEELLKPDAQASAPDFSQMSDEELLKPDAQDFSHMSDEELLKPDAAQEPEKKPKYGSPTWAGVKGFFGGLVEGIWAGGNAAANKIVKALPEVGIGLESAAGHAARFAGKGLKAIGAEKVGAAVESAGKWIVGDAAGAKTWLDSKLPSEAKDWQGYEDWSTKASDWVGNAAAMAVKFAPGGAKIGGEAFMESVFASDGANAFANAHDTAIANGASETEAAALGAEAALINYAAGKALMRSGGWAAGIEGAGRQFLASGAASSATMAAQGAGNRMVENLAERKPLMEGVAAETGKGLVEGAMFHVYNAIPGYARGVVQSREARRENEEYIRGVILDHAKTDEGAAQLATYFDGPSLDAAIQARKAGKKITRKMASDIGLPEVMTLEEVGGVIDAVSSQRRAWAERARTRMDGQQAAALAETIASYAGEDKALFESTWFKVLEKIEDARELDDPTRREELVQAAMESDQPVKGGSPGLEGEVGRSSAVKSKALDLLGKMDEGAMPAEDVAIGDIEGLAPTENGNVIGDYDPAKAKPIVVWEDLEGNRHAVTGGKRLAMAGASGAETVKAVVIKEADGGTEANGWTEAEARSLGATENLKEGSGGLKNVVEAVDTIGADGVAELAGWHQANGSRDFASTIRKGLAVAQKCGTELKAALAEGQIGEDMAYNIAQVLSMERVGEGWEAAQRELAGLVGKVGPEELEAVLWGLKRQLSAKADRSDIDWGAAIAEERAKYNAKKGGAEGKLDSDQVLLETADGELKTLGEIEAESGKFSPTESPENKGEKVAVDESAEGGGKVGQTAEAPELAAAQGAGANRAVELRPIQGRDGAFGTLSHPRARFTVDGERKAVFVEGLTPEDFAPGRAEQTAALVARIEAYAVDNGLKISFPDEATRDAWARMRENIEAEGKEAFSRTQMEAKRNAVVDRLKQSGLATEVVQTKGDFDRLVTELNGRPLTAGEEVYGFCDTSTGKVYLNPDFFATRQALEAPIHEFGHLGVIAAQKVNKAVYDRGMKLAGELLESGLKPAAPIKGGVAEIVDFILKDEYYSTRGRQEQAEELLAQLIGKRGEEALRSETSKTVVNRIKSWLVEFWNTFGKALGLKDITPEEAAKMTVEQVADAIRAEMMSGQKYGEGLARVEFGDGGARIVTKPTRIKRKLTGRRKAVNEFVNRMGGAEDPANVETDLLALWVDNGGRLFDALPFEIETSYSKGKTGVKTTRRAVADEFTESTAFYQDLDAAQRRVFFGTEKLETGPIGEGLKNRLQEAGITRFTREDGTVDYEGLIDEFKRQWTNYERGEEVLKERGEWQEEHDRAIVEEMERAEQAAYDEMSAEEAAGRAEMEAVDEATAAQIAADIAAGRFSRSGIFTGTAADYANRSRQGGVDDGPSLKKIGTGEGSQVYGWGLYGSTKRGVAERYARIAKEENRYRDVVEWKGYKKIGNRITEPSTDLVVENALSVVIGHKGDITKAIDFLRESIGKYGPIEDAETTKTIDWLEQHGSEINYTHAPQGQHLYEQTFFTDRAPGDESHLLKWYEDLPKEQVDWIAQEFAKEGFFVAEFSGLKGWTILDKASGKKLSLWDKRESGDTYEAIASFLGSPQAASEFLARAGIDGVKYPVDSYGGKGVKDGDKAGWNYVSFRDDNIRVDHKWTDGKLRFSMAGKPSALGDGKQRYYEVPFDKAVDKIVKNKKPVSRDHVFVSETPKAFADIGFARLPVMMGQGHVISCYFGEGEGVEGEHLHKMKGNLKLLPKALEKPLMIITSESSPSDSVVAILKMKDNTGASVIVPVKMSGVGRVGKDLVDAHIALTMFGKKNAWKSLVANALEKEANGEVGVFYIDGAESKTILERLGEKAKGLGIAGLQSPGETKAHRNPENGRSGLQSPSRSISQGTVHSIADAGSPVKGGIVAQTATRQFKRWFANSKVVDRSGNPRIVYHGTPNGKFWTFDKNRIGETWNADETGFFFTSSKSQAEEYTRPYFRENTATPNLFSVYLSIQNPLVIDRAWWQKQFGRSDIYNHDAIEIWDTEQQTILDAMREGGHDGVIIDPNPMGGAAKMYMVPEPTQIKSATDNIGTFDVGNPDIRFSRGGKPPEAELVVGTRVADDAGVGERTPGAIAASRELSRQGAVPLTTKGRRYVSLPLSEMNALARYLTGHALPGEMQSGRKLGAAGKASAKQRKLVIAADVLGTIDKSDMAVEKEFLKQHGFYKNEDAQWAAVHSKAEMRQERERGDAALSSRLEALADRRAQGKEPGGQSAARRVYADQLAQIVMAMPHGQPGVLGAMQTVAGALEKRVRGSETEAEAFLDWMEGGLKPAAPRSAQERKAGMFAAFLMMPKEMEARAKGWYDAMRSTIAGDKKLTAAFREMTVRMMTEQGFGHLQAEIEKDISRQHEQAVEKLKREADESIKPKSRRAKIKEAVVLTFDDKGGAALVRIGERERMYLGAQRKLMKQAKTPQERALIKQQIDAYLGDMGQKMNTLALARAAWERGSGNADSVYDMKLCDALNEALVRNGLRFIDLSLYLDQQRVIESKGLSGSRGESARQAQVILDTMKKRLGADFAKVEAFAQKFHAIHEQEFLNSPALERVLGKRTLDAWRENIHYVTTKRQFSPEELKEIEAERAALRKTGAFGGDDMVGDAYKYMTRLDPTAGLRGSFASKREVMSATMEKTGAIMHWARKCNYVIELRDALLAAGVEGVHDMPAGTNELKSRKRYGTISYVENGQKRTLVVPKEIAKDFKQTDSYDNAAIRLLASCNNFARRMVIDYNLPYGLSNMWRNVGSAESNVPGMREAAIKRASRFVLPGVATAEEIAMQLLVRNMPEKWSLPLRKMWGEHTALYWLPQAKRIAMWLTDYNKMQRKFWKAEQRGDLGTLQQMEEDRRWAIMAKKANMFHSMTTGRIADPSMLDAQMQRSGMTLMSSERRERDAKPKWRRALDFVNIFQRNARQQVYEDVLIKTIVFLHDRAQFGKTHNRTLEESGLIARKYAGIPETERKGLATPGIQALFNPFWGAIEKGVVRHVDAIRERSKETLQKDAWRLSARITSMLLGNGALAAYILYLNDGDEEKAKNGKLGAVYSYARGYQRAYQNCSNYVRNNYHITPLWTKGYTSIILGMPLTDEERILEPVASLISDAAAVAAGTKQSLHMQEHLLNLTKVIAPDFKMAGFGVTLFDDTLGTFLYEPKDYYTGGYKYDRDLYATRYESLSDFGQFSWAVAKRLWNDFGGRGILPTDRSGVDNGLGEEPGWVARAVNSIPIASPYARRMVKVQVGSPRRDAEEILEAERIRQACIRKSAKRMFKIAHDEKRDLSLDPVRYGEMLDKWQKAYGLTPDEMAQLEGRYLNAWRAYEGAQYRADGEREKFRAKAEKLGIEAAGIYLDWD